MDASELERLIQLMDRHDLVEIEVSSEPGRTVRLRKRESPPPPASLSAYDAPSPSIAPPTAPSDQAEGALIRSPMVGTFYRSPSPESLPFVEVGDPIEPDSTVCIVEAMKVFNEIKADVAGTITAILVENADGVEYDTPLFRVAPKE